MRGSKWAGLSGPKRSVVASFAEYTPHLHRLFNIISCISPPAAAAPPPVLAFLAAAPFGAALALRFGGMLYASRRAVV